MWARKHIDISFRQIMMGARGLFSFCRRKTITAKIRESFGGDKALVCLSVRSGFDLLLRAADWPANSEIVFTGMTIRDMPRIAREHGLVPVGVDIDAATLAPRLSDIEEAITPNTRAIVVAHLFGGRVALKEIQDLFTRKGIMLIEDCAQAYVGNHYSGSESADISMFSFGPIKTNTALGGGVMMIRRPNLLHTMNQIQKGYSVQSRGAFLQRLLKYFAIKAVTTRIGAALFYRACRLGRTCHDRLASQLARGFDGEGFFLKIRQQPSLPLLRLLSHRLITFDEETIRRRRALGERIDQHCGSGICFVGNNVSDPTHWVMAIAAPDSKKIGRNLWCSGFDATSRSSMVAVNTHCTGVERLLEQILFIPIHIQMTKHEIERMAKILRDDSEVHTREFDNPRTIIPSHND